MTWRDNRVKLVALLLQSILVLSIIFGLFPFKYDKKSHEIAKSRTATVYCIVVNFVTLSVLLSALPFPHNNDVRFLQEKPINLVINTVNIFVNGTALAATLLGNWIGRKKSYDILAEILFIKQNYFGEHIKNGYFDSLVICRSMLTLMQMVSSMCAMYTINPTPSWGFILLMAMVFMLQNIIFFIGIHFYLAVLYVGCYFEELNKNLQRLQAELKQKPYSKRRRKRKHQNIFELFQFMSDFEFSTQIDALAKLYLRLYRLSNRINETYQLRVLLLVLATSMDLILHGFYFLVFVKGKILEFHWYTALLYGQVIIVNLLDFNLIITVCEHKTCSSQKTLKLLSCFNDFFTLDAGLERSLEAMALQCSCVTLRHSMCGLFDLNRKTGHALVITTMLYLVVLVQYDYKNL